jgi:8-oxo-dGTP pyrophosphatase MutT (NUDIX family)
MSTPYSRDRLSAALHPLLRVPSDAPWNLSELADLLPPVLTPAAVLIGVVAHPEPTVILTQRTKGLTHHAGQVSFPGGRIDPEDAGPVEAALREAREEIGLTSDAIEALGFLDPFATITGFHVMPVVAWIAPQAAYRHAPSEVEEVFEAPLSFLLDPANAQLREREFRGRKRRYHVYDWNGREIWGATAAMLVNLRERLQGPV